MPKTNYNMTSKVSAFRLKIRQKSIALFFLCALLPLIGVSVGAYLTAQSAMRDFVTAELSLAARGALNQLELFFSDALADLDSWSKLRVMQDILIDDDEGEIYAELEQFHKQHPYFAELLVANTDGIVVTATHQKNKGKDLFGKTLFAVVLRGEIYQGPVENSEFLDREAMVFAIPLRADYDQNTVIGTLIGVVDWEQVQGILAKVSMTGTLQDSDHVLNLMVGGGFVEFKYRFLYETPTAVGLFDTETVSMLHEHGEIQEIPTASGDYLIGTAKSKGRAPFTDPGWFLHAAVSSQNAFASIERLRTQFFVLGTLVGFAALFIGWFGGNSLVRPIISLIAAMKQLAAGNTEITIPALGRSDEIGDMAAALKVFQDRARGRARAQKELLRAKQAAELANRSKSDFLANMSHELRTPLNAVIGFSDLIKGEMLGPVGSPKYREYAGDINDSGQHLLALINDILDLSKIEAGKLDLQEETVDVEKLVNSSVNIVKVRAQEADLTLTSKISNLLPQLYCDERKLKQILLNLLSNAVKFTPPKGSITIETSADSENGFTFSVTDTGIGISKEDMEKALEPFRQIDSKLSRQYEGTGLGLPLAKGLVELHGGYLALNSEPGVGTTVTIHFPPDRIRAWGSETALAAGY